MAVVQLSARRARKQRRNGSETLFRRRPSKNLVRSMLIGLLLWVAVVFLYYAGGAVVHTNVAIGQRSRDTVVAAVSFRTTDIARTALLKKQAAASVLPVFTIDATGINTSVRTLTKFYDRMALLRTQEANGLSPEELRAKVGDLVFLLGLQLDAEEALALAPVSQAKEISSALRKAMRTVWDHGIVSERERSSRFDGVASSNAITILSDRQETRSPVPVRDLLQPTEARELAVSLVVEAMEEIKLSETTLGRLIGEWLAPNLRYDAVTSEEQRKEAEKVITPEDMPVAAGSTMVEAGQRITPHIVGLLNAHQQRLAEMESRKDRFLDRIGHAGLFLLGLIIAAGLLRVVCPELPSSPRTIALLAILSLTTLIPAKVLLVLAASTKVAPPALIDLLLPLALAPLLAAVLVDERPAVVVGIWSSFATAVLSSHSFFVLTIGLLITIVASASSRNIRRRAQLLRIGFSIGLSTVAIVLCRAALNQVVGDLLISQLIAAMCCGLVCALAAALLIPVFEWTFGLTTDISLLELSDMGHPVLERLAIEAPGTYHHSLMVANLSQAAAAEVSANPLLVRVCAYYHDIGKLTKPEFFVENMQYAQNPHDDLSPSMSALVIISHVKEGIAMARRYKLPRPILDGIAQHHGTGLIYYFHHRALKQLENGENPSSRQISEDDFRYPGPKPHSREMGILLLADSVEAASRSMEKPTSTRIESLVNEIVDVRMKDGQLDGCDLTFAQVTKIRQSFIFTLTNMLHGRVAYPKHEDRNKQQTKPPSGQHDKNQNSQPLAHAAG